MIFILAFFIQFASAQGFHRYTDLEADLVKLNSAHPKLVKLDTAGMSLEGRAIRVIRLGTTEAQSSILVVGGTHARERISYELPYRFAKKLLEEESSLLKKVSVHVLPMLNPDGVEYDHTQSGKLSWRKNRRPLPGGAYGVDLNRNFSFGWSNLGASDSPFSDIYKGSAPFSEPESRALRDYINAHPEIKLIVTYHSFGEQVFYPWGSRYSPMEPALFKLHRDLAEGYAQLTGYNPMQSSAPGLVTGDLCDWSVGEKKIPCLGIELDPKEHQNYGHYLPEREIPNVINRNWSAFLFLLNSISRGP